MTMLLFIVSYLFTGGTIDITVHEVQSDGHLKELYNANGGAWGGAYVDKVSFLLCLYYIGVDKQTF